MEAICNYDEINFPSIYIAKFENQHFNLDQFKEDFQVKHLLEDFQNDHIEGILFQNCMIQGLSGLSELFPNIQHIVFKNSILDNIEWKSFEIFKKLKTFKAENCTIELFLGTIFERCSSMLFRVDEKEEKFANLEAEMIIREPRKNVFPVEPLRIPQIAEVTLEMLKANEQNYGVPLQRDELDALNAKTQETLENVAKSLKTLRNAHSSSSESEEDLFVEQKHTALGAIKKTNNHSRKLDDFNFKSSGPISLALGPGWTNLMAPQQFKQKSASSSLIPSPSGSSVSLTESEKNILVNSKSAKDCDDSKTLRQRCSKLEGHIITLTSQLETSHMEIAKLNMMLNDLKKVFADDDFRDFTFKIKESSFLVHKVLFAAKSSVFARMIKNNPYAEEMNLVDIPITTFQIIFDFIYNNRLPTNDDNLIEIFAASGRLNIVELMNIAAKKMIKVIDEKNALDYLILAHKYGNEELRQKAFRCIQEKIFPDRKLDEEFSKQPEKIKKLIEMKKRLDEEYEKMKKEIELFEIDDKEMKEKICDQKSSDSFSPTGSGDDNDEDFCMVASGNSTKQT